QFRHLFKMGRDWKNLRQLACEGGCGPIFMRRATRFALFFRPADGHLRVAGLTLSTGFWARLISQRRTARLGSETAQRTSAIARRSPCPRWLPACLARSL